MSGLDVIVRISNALLAGGSLLMLTAILWARWHLMSWRMRRIGIGLGNVLAVIAYGSGEALHSHVPTGPRVWLLLAALGSLTAALAWRLEVHSDDPHTL